MAGDALTEDADQIRARAVALLARREHSRRELEDKLLRRGADGVLLGAVLDRLERDDLLSDARFAAAYVESRASRGFGPLRILGELEQRGIGAPAREIACEPAGREWMQRAREARHKRFGAAAPEDFRDRARQARFLTQRGFSASQIRAALGAHVDDDP